MGSRHERLKYSSFSIENLRAHTQHTVYVRVVAINTRFYLLQREIETLARTLTLWAGHRWAQISELGAADNSLTVTPCRFTRRERSKQASPNRRSVRVSSPSPSGASSGRHA